MRQPALVTADGLARALQVPELRLTSAFLVQEWSCWPQQRPQQLFCWDSTLTTAGDGKQLDSRAPQAIHFTDVSVPR